MFLYFFSRTLIGIETSRTAIGRKIGIVIGTGIRIDTGIGIEKMTIIENLAETKKTKNEINLWTEIKR